jgi:hypothetical protein
MGCAVAKLVFVGGAPPVPLEPPVAPLEVVAVVVAVVVLDVVAVVVDVLVVVPEAVTEPAGDAMPPTPVALVTLPPQAPTPAVAAPRAATIQ